MFPLYFADIAWYTRSCLKCSLKCLSQVFVGNVCCYLQFFLWRHVGSDVELGEEDEEDGRLADDVVREPDREVALVAEDLKCFYFVLHNEWIYCSTLDRIVCKILGSKIDSLFLCLKINYYFIRIVPDQLRKLSFSNLLNKSLTFSIVLFYK